MVNGPLHRGWSPITLPASWIFGRAVAMRNARLDRQVAWRAPRPVVSVGNISAGGTGKSPMVRWICEQLGQAGLRPAIAMRGYRGHAGSDEAAEHRESLPTVPVWIGADRRAAIESGLACDPEIGVIVLDDGFQHRRVARAFDLALVDASRPSLEGAMLPHGWLREPWSALRRASAVVLTRSEDPDAALDSAVRSAHGRPPLARCGHAWSGVACHEGSAAVEARIERLRGASVAVWAGVGHPQAVVADATRHGARVVDVPPLADHQRFDPSLVARLVVRARAAGAAAVLCTPKDWVKLRFVPVPMPVLVPRVTLRFESGEAELRSELLAAVRAWTGL